MTRETKIVVAVVASALFGGLAAAGAWILKPREQSAAVPEAEPAEVDDELSNENSEPLENQIREPKTVAELERLVQLSETADGPAELATNLVDLATAHVHAGNESRAPALVARARRLIEQCEARGECQGNELLEALTELDFARIERALQTGDTGVANRLMRDIAARAARDGADPCSALEDVVFSRVEERVKRCEQLANAGKLDEANRAYDIVFRVLELAEAAGDCTDLVDPYLFSDLTMTVLRADLVAGRYARARARIDTLARYGRTHFDRGELRDTVRYDITDLVLELATTAAKHDDLDRAHRLQRFLLQLYSARGLTDGPTMCEVVAAMSDSDLEGLEDHLEAEELDAAEALIERLRTRYTDYRIRRCAPEMFHELAITIGEHALDAADRHESANAQRLLTLARELCSKAGPECEVELRELERDMRR